MIQLSPEERGTRSDLIFVHLRKPDVYEDALSSPACGTGRSPLYYMECNEGLGRTFAAEKFETEDAAHD